MTLEDESGFVNLVIWQDVFKEFALIVKTASILGVTGRVQSEDGVTHVIAKKLWLPKFPRAAVAHSKSRDFH